MLGWALQWALNLEEQTCQKSVRQLVQTLRKDINYETHGDSSLRTHWLQNPSLPTVRWSLESSSSKLSDDLRNRRDSSTFGVGSKEGETDGSLALWRRALEGPLFVDVANA